MTFHVTPRQAIRRYIAAQEEFVDEWLAHDNGEPDTDPHGALLALIHA